MYICPSYTFMVLEVTGEEVFVFTYIFDLLGTSQVCMPSDFSQPPESLNALALLECSTFLAVTVSCIASIYQSNSKFMP